MATEADNLQSPSSEGTAARTRPCSMEDIILRRYSKKLIKNAEEANKQTKCEITKPTENKDGTSKQGGVTGKRMDSEDLKSRVSGQKEQKHSTSSAIRTDKNIHSSSISSSVHLIKNVEKERNPAENPKSTGKDVKKEKKGHRHNENDENLRDKVREGSENAKNKISKKDSHEERGDQKKHKDGREEKKKNHDKNVTKESKRKYDDEIEDSRNFENDRSSKRKCETKLEMLEKHDKRGGDFDRYEKQKRPSNSSRQKEEGSRHSKRSPSPDHKKSKERRRSRSLDHKKSKERRRSSSPDRKKMKERRSPSPDHKKIKERKSPSPDHKKSKERRRSPSPLRKSDKRLSSHHTKDYDIDRSAHRSSVEGSDRHRDATTRNEKEKNSSFSSHVGNYKRYGPGSSGLGGYSPRKRKSETAVKTPSPPPRSPDRKPAWDLTPGGMDSNMVAAMVAAYQASTHQVSIPSATTTVPAGPALLQKPFLAAPSTVQPNNNQAVTLADTIELTQSTRPSRRLYISNLPSSVAEEELIDFVNSSMLCTSSNHIPGTKPCISCVINMDRNQAFVEFITPVDATAALSLDGISFKGVDLKIKRPKDFVEPANGELEKGMPDADLISDVVKDSPNKIFVSGFSYKLGSQKIKEIVAAFGQLKAFRLELNKDIKPPEVFVFLEYMDPLLTLKACAGLNGMKIAGSVLTAVQATPDVSTEDEADIIPFYGVPEYAKSLMQIPSRVIELRNVLAREDLQQLTDNELDEILEDVRLECTRFGTVKSVNIVKDNKTVKENGGDQDSSANPSNCTENQVNSSTQIVIEDSKLQQNSAMQINKDDDVTHTIADISANGARDGLICCCSGISDCASHEKQEQTDRKQPVQHGGNSKEPRDPPLSESLAATAIDEIQSVTSDMVDNKTSLNMGISNREGEHRGPVDGEKLTNGEADKNSPNSEERKSTPTSDQLEVASIFVEFLREETACLAAHNLHGREYGSKKVSVSYFSETSYQRWFPRRIVR